MSRRTSSTLLPGVLAAVALAGCPGRDARFSVGLAPLAPVPVAGGLLYVEHDGARAYFLDLAADTPAVHTAPLGQDPVSAVARAGHPEALVLSRGARGDTGVSPEPATLAAVAAGATGAPAVAVRTYRVGSPFNGVAQTPDGRFAFVYFRPDASAARLLFNPNEVAVADLDAPPGPANPVLRTVRSFGGVPNDVVFSPPLSIGGAAPRTFAVVLSDAYVTLMDLAHLDRPEVTVRLTLPEDPRAVRPTQVLFDASDPTVYIRAQASDDVYVLALGPSTAAGATDNDYRPTVNQLAAGHLPTDMALFGTGTARRLLVVAPGSMEARVVDARANTVTPIPLAARADRVLLFQAPSPHDATPHEQALLYAADSATTAVTFLDLADVETRRGMNLETVQLPRAVRSALPLPERGAVMFSHVDSQDGSLSLLDLTRRTASPIVAEVGIDNATFGVDRQTLWVAPPSGVRLGYIDLGTFHPGEVRLDAQVTAVVPLTGDPRGRSRVAALHPGAGGYVTVLDAAAPLRGTAVSVQGFLLADVLNQEAP